MQRDYWAALNDVLMTMRGPVQGNRKPQPANWMSYPIGRAYFHINAVMDRHRGQVRAELYMSGDKAKRLLCAAEAAAGSYRIPTRLPPPVG